MPAAAPTADVSSESLNEFLSQLVEGALCALEDAGCVSLGDANQDDDSVEPTTAGR